MKTYAQIDSSAISEIIQPWANEQGEEVPIEQRFTPEFVAALVDITDIDPPPLEGWTATEADGVWSFAPYTPPPPTPQEILAKNSNDQMVLLDIASRSMTPLLVSLQLGNATDEETTLARAWQTYCRALKMVDMAVAVPDWPIAPE